MARHEYAGGAVSTTISSGINASDVTISISSATGWPTGAIGKFLVAIDRGLSSEEKIYVLSRSGTTLTVQSAGDRGADGTTAQSHSSGATIEHCFGAVDADAADAHINGTGDVHPQYYRKTVAEGAGLVANGNAIDVNVDGSTLEIASDTLRMKNAGITLAKFPTTLRPVTICTAATHPGSPSVGDLLFETDTGKILEYQSATTGWTPPWNTAWGQQAYAQITANQTGIGTTETDITSLSVSFTAVANRRLRTSLCTPQIISGGSQLVTTKITDTSNVGKTNGYVIISGITISSVTAQVTETSAAGTFARKGRVFTSTSTCTVGAASDVPSFILVEDIGPAGVPT